MTKSINVRGRQIGSESPPFIIAEMSGNHNGSLDRAVEIVKQAAKSGVDCLKFQTYTADTITLNSGEADFTICDEASLWNNRRLHSLYDEAHTPWEWHEVLFNVAKEYGVIAFSSPFDLSAVDFLEELGVPMYKIASFEITHLPLIERVALTGKPLIMSTGIASLEDIELALETARGAGAENIILLKCTSAYPASAKDANLATIKDMRNRFGCQVGLSDHTLGIGVGVASVMLGATVIEKHFTLDRKDGGVDSEFSLEPFEMRMLKEECVRAWEAIGEVSYNGASKARTFCQSIWPSQDIKKGDVFSQENLKICRPGLSLPPKNFTKLIGKRALRDIKFASRLTDIDFS